MVIRLKEFTGLLLLASFLLRSAAFAAYTYQTTCISTIDFTATVTLPTNNAFLIAPVINFVSSSAPLGDGVFYLEGATVSPNSLTGPFGCELIYGSSDFSNDTTVFNEILHQVTSWTIVPVPEPSPAAIIAIGTGGFLVWHRWKLVRFRLRDKKPGLG